MPTARKRRVGAPTPTSTSHSARPNNTPQRRTQLAEAIPLPGSGVTLPLNLHQIAARCSNAYYSPKRFSAVQLAYDVPRARILVFHTGRLVQTGCAGPMEARLSVMRAVRQLQLEAGIHVRVRNFAVINQVGAASLHARLDCDRFATTHSSSAHYDRQSFVGLAWRAPGEACCCEIYQTGRSNLPGSTRERDLLRSFSRMYPQLILHSDHPERLALVPEHLRNAHAPAADAAAPPSSGGVKTAGASTAAAAASADESGAPGASVDAWAPLPPLTATGAGLGFGLGLGLGLESGNANLDAEDDDANASLLAAAGL